MCTQEAGTQGDDGEHAPATSGLCSASSQEESASSQEEAWPLLLLWQTRSCAGTCGPTPSDIPEVHTASFQCSLASAILWLWQFALKLDILQAEDSMVLALLDPSDTICWTMLVQEQSLTRAHHCSGHHIAACMKRWTGANVSRGVAEVISHLQKEIKSLLFWRVAGERSFWLSSMADTDASVM